MSRRNYTNYSKQSGQEEQPVVEELEVAQENETVAKVEETVVAPAAAEATAVVEAMQMSPAILGSGVVCNCAKLNIREQPEVSSRVSGIVNAGTELVIYDGSFGNFYKVCTASGVEGYCMKDYVSLK